MESHAKISLSTTLSTKRGETCSILPSKPIAMDLTIFMDISKIHGPSRGSSSSSSENPAQVVPSRLSATAFSQVNYSKSQFLSLRKSVAVSQILTPTLLILIKLFRARGKRAGKLTHLKTAMQYRSVPAIIPGVINR